MAQRVCHCQEREPRAVTSIDLTKGHEHSNKPLDAESMDIALIFINDTDAAVVKQLSLLFYTLHLQPYDLPCR